MPSPQRSKNGPKHNEIEWKSNTVSLVNPTIFLPIPPLRSRVESVDLFYLHAPDRNTPLLETLRVVHELASEGLFREWGLSNYAAWETVDIWHTCK